MKKLAAIILCLCLCLTLFSAMALTASAAPAASIYINGQTLGIGGSISVNGGTAKAEYNGGTDTLIITLTDCSIGSTTTIGSSSYGFYVESDITNIMVKLNGENICESTFRIQGDATYMDGTTNFLSGTDGDGALTVNGKFSVEHGDVYVDACALTLTGQNTNDTYAAYINNSLTVGSPAVKGGSFSEPYITLDTERNIGMWINGFMTVNSGNSTFTGRYYGLFIIDTGNRSVFNVSGGYTACSGNQAGILLTFLNDTDVNPVNFTNGCGEFNFGRLDCREDFDFGGSNKHAKFFSWMKPEWTNALTVNGTRDDVYGGTLSCNAMTSMYFRQMDSVYVTYDAGEFGELDQATYALPYGQEIGVMPVPRNTTLQAGPFNGMSFAGWCPDGTDTRITEDYIPTKSIKLRAAWEKNPVKSFSDVPAGAWFKNAVDYCSQVGLVSGTSDTTFSPSTVCNRAMVVTMLYSAAGRPEVDLSSNPFSDVADSAWYAKPVVWAAANGIVSGVGDGKFAPTSSITREQLACIMQQFASYRGLCDPHGYKPITDFPDYENTHSWAETGVSWAVGSGLISGKARDGKIYLDPRATATRAELATILMSYQKLTDGARTFFCKDYAITVPETWQGNVTAERCTDGLSFYSSRILEATRGEGRLFSMIFTPEYEYIHWPNYWEFYGVMLDNNTYSIVDNVLFSFPSDVQCDPSLPADFHALYAAMQDMYDRFAVYSHNSMLSFGVG